MTQLLSLSKICQSSNSLSSGIRFPLKIKPSSIYCTLEILFHDEVEARWLWIASITSIWVVPSYSPFQCFHYRHYQILAFTLPNLHIVSYYYPFFCFFCCLSSFISFYYKVTFPCTESLCLFLLMHQFSELASIYCFKQLIHGLKWENRIIPHFKWSMERND